MTKFAVIILFFALNACLLAAPRAFVAIPTLAEAVKAVGGEHWQVDALLPPGANPETFQPDARTINALSRAQVFFTIGTPCEAGLLPKLRRNFPKLRIADGCRGMAILPMEPGDGPDPHVWLSIPNLICFTQTAAAELAAVDAEHASEYRANAQAFISRLQELDARIALQLQPLKGREILVFHPAFGYFLEHYGLKQLPIETEGKEPPGGYLVRVLKRAQEIQAPALFIQPQFSRKSAETIAGELNCKLAELDPLPGTITGGLTALADAISQAYIAPQR